MSCKDFMFVFFTTQRKLHREKLPKTIGYWKVWFSERLKWLFGNL